MDFFSKLPPCVRSLARIREELLTTSRATRKDTKTRQKIRDGSAEPCAKHRRLSGTAPKPQTLHSHLPSLKNATHVNTTVWPPRPELQTCADRTRTRTRTCGHTHDQEPTRPICRFPPPMYFRVRTGPGGSVPHDGFDVYIGPPWRTALKCPHPCLELSGLRIQDFERRLTQETRQNTGTRAVVVALAGKRLGCWCRTESVCHAAAIIRVWKTLVSQ
jgi:hypothetical protein